MLLNKLQYNAFLTFSMWLLLCKNPPANAGNTEMWVQLQVRSLGENDPLEKEMITHSSILAW